MPDNPFKIVVANTSSNSVVFSPPATGIYVGGAGNVSVRFAGGANAVFVAVPAGVTLDVRVDQVLTNTTATNFLVLR